MIAIETNIITLSKDIEHSAQAFIEKGSDKHLDLLLSVINPLNALSDKLEELNEFLWENAGNYAEKELEEAVLPKLKQLQKVCVLLIGAINVSSFRDDIKDALNRYIGEYNNFVEILYDMENFILSKDTELLALMEKLNQE